MLKKLLNEIRFTFHIEATGPILIKDGETKKEAEERKETEKQRNIKHIHMRFVVDGNQRIFIPGSSIRGVWRSWCERIARTISNSVPLACDPFNNDIDNQNVSCSRRLEDKEIGTDKVYAESCPICKLFGNTLQASRIKISDAYIEGTTPDRKDLPIRDGIGIDRFTGGVSSGANFNYQYVINKIFVTEVNIRNFELWQLGLLGYLLRDFEEELVPMGFGKTRGLGKVKGKVDKATLVFYGPNRPEIDEPNKKVTIAGIGSLYSDGDKTQYCFAQEPPLKDIECDEVKKDPIKTTITLSAKQADSLFNSAADFWAKSEKEGYFLTARKQRNKIAEEKKEKIAGGSKDA